MESLGIKLKVARVKSRLNQSEAVEKLKGYGINITQSYLSKFENDVNEPDIRQLKALAKVYNIDVLTLIFTDDESDEI